MVLLLFLRLVAYAKLSSERRIPQYGKLSSESMKVSYVRVLPSVPGPLSLRGRSDPQTKRKDPRKHFPVLSLTKPVFPSIQNRKRTIYVWKTAENIKGREKENMKVSANMGG